MLALVVAVSVSACSAQKNRRISHPKVLTRNRTAQGLTCQQIHYHPIGHVYSGIRKKTNMLYCLTTNELQQAGESEFIHNYVDLFDAL